ncbi:MAG: hypothetical protein KC619_32795, partial [Myxococcales bacterium]|nr:hypothetical protein [Myxococcales bacterium]
MAEVDERGSLGSTPTRFYRCDVCGMPHELVPGERRCLFGEDTPSERSSAPERAGGPEKIAGRYVVRGELGAGAFGVVYDCWDLRLDRQVAVKVGPVP